MTKSSSMKLHLFLIISAFLSFAANLSAVCLFPHVDESVSIERAQSMTNVVLIDLATAYGSGVLIGESLVLTNAHVAKSIWRVFGGSVMFTDEHGNTEMRAIAEAHIHPEYNEVTGDCDIAILKLGNAVDVGKYTPARFFRGSINDLIGQVIHGAGYGRKFPANTKASNTRDILQKLYYETMYTINNEGDCSQFSSQAKLCTAFLPVSGAPLGEPIYHEKTFLDFQGKTAPGDSGSPQFNRQNELVAIAVSGMLITEEDVKGVGFQEELWATVEECFEKVKANINRINLMLEIEEVDLQPFRSNRGRDLEAAIGNIQRGFALAVIQGRLSREEQDRMIELAHEINRNREVISLFVANHLGPDAVKEDMEYLDIFVPISDHLAWIEATMDKIEAGTAEGISFSVPLWVDVLSQSLLLCLLNHYLY